MVVTPTLRAGLSDHHLAFPGTVSLSQETFRGWVDAHIAGLERIGIERIAVFSGHGGNFAFIGELAAEHTSRPGPTRVIAYDDLFGFVRVMDEAARAHGLEAPETDVHAGALETSVGLALFDALVGDYDGVEGYTAAEPGWTERIWTDGIAALSSTGVLGDPAGATAEAGQAIFDALADELAGWIAREFDIPLAALSAPGLPGCCRYVSQWHPRHRARRSLQEAPSARASSARWWPPLPSSTASFSGRPSRCSRPRSDR